MAIKQIDKILNQLKSKKDFTKIIQLTLCEIIIKNNLSTSDLDDTLERFCERTQQNEQVVLNSIMQHRAKANQSKIAKQEQELQNIVNSELSDIDNMIEAKLFTWETINKRPYNITKKFGYKVYRDVDTSDYLIMSQTGQSDIVIYKKNIKQLTDYLSSIINPPLNNEQIANGEKEFEMIVPLKGGGQDIIPLDFEVSNFNRITQVRPTFDPLAISLISKDDTYSTINRLNLYSPTQLMSIIPTEEKELEPLTKSYLLNLFGDEEAFEWMMNWLAINYQTKTKAIRSPLIISVEGTGKGLLYQIIDKIYGNFAFMDDKSEIFTQQFNGELANKLYCFLDELNVNEMEKGAYRNLKGWLASNYKFNVNFKNGYKGQYPLYANFIAYSNDDNCVTLTQGDRRWNVFRSIQSMETCDWIINNSAEETAIKLLSKKYIKNFAEYLCNYPIDMTLRNKKIKNAEWQRLMEASEDVIVTIWRNLCNKNLKYFKDEGLESTRYIKSDNSYGSNLYMLIEKCYQQNKVPVNLFNQIITSISGVKYSPKMIKSFIPNFKNSKNLTFFWREETEPVYGKCYELPNNNEQIDDNEDEEIEILNDIEIEILNDIEIEIPIKEDDIVIKKTGVKVLKRLKKKILLGGIR